MKVFQKSLMLVVSLLNFSMTYCMDRSFGYNPNAGVRLRGASPTRNAETERSNSLASTLARLEALEKRLREINQEPVVINPDSTMDLMQECWSRAAVAVRPGSGVRLATASSSVTAEENYLERIASVLTRIETQERLVKERIEQADREKRRARFGNPVGTGMMPPF